MATTEEDTKRLAFYDATVEPLGELWRNDYTAAVKLTHKYGDYLNKVRPHERQAFYKALKAAVLAADEKIANKVAKATADLYG